jgi:hypothetical protein
VTWVGWALLSPTHLASLSADADEHDLEQHLLAAGGRMSGAR